MIGRLPALHRNILDISKAIQPCFYGNLFWDLTPPRMHTKQELHIMSFLQDDVHKKNGVISIFFLNCSSAYYWIDKPSSTRCGTIPLIRQSSFTLFMMTLNISATILKRSIEGISTILYISVCLFLNCENGTQIQIKWKKIFFKQGHLL